LCVAQRKAQHADGEAVDEHEGGEVAAGQEHEVGAKPVDQQPAAQGGEDGAKRHLADVELSVRDQLRAVCGGRHTVLLVLLLLLLPLHDGTGARCYDTAAVEPVV